MVLWQPPLPSLFTCISLLCIVGLALGQQQSLDNITIDDSSAEIIYSPSDSWKIGQLCRKCDLQLDPGRTSQGTWHYGFVDQFHTPLFANFSFSGSAIHVYGILPPTSLRHPYVSKVTFWIDNARAGEYELSTGEDEYRYNFSLYSNTNLEDGDHVFSLQNGPPAGPMEPASLVILDYLIYSRTSESVSGNLANSTDTVGRTSSGPNIGAIAGGILGGLTAFLLVAFCALVYYCRKHNQPIIPPAIASKINPQNWFGPNSPTNCRTFNPEMMVATGGAPPAVDLTRGEGDYTDPALTSNQRRILAWQRQTAEANAGDPLDMASTNVLPRSDALSSYWDQSTESYKDWEARQISSPVPDLPTKASLPPVENNPSAGPSRLPPLPTPFPLDSPTLPDQLPPSSWHPPLPPDLPGAIQRETSPSPSATYQTTIPPPAAVSTPRTPRRVTRRLTVMNN